MEKDLSKELRIRTITTVELLASKILSLLRKSTGDYDLKKKIRNSDMSAEAITDDAIHKYMFEILNESPETEEEKNPIRGQKKIKQDENASSRRYI